MPRRGEPALRRRGHGQWACSSALKERDGAGSVLRDRLELASLRALGESVQDGRIRTFSDEDGVNLDPEALIRRHTNRGETRQIEGKGHWKQRGEAGTRQGGAQAWAARSSIWRDWHPLVGAPSVKRMRCLLEDAVAISPKAVKACRIQTETAAC